ncbi:MULTISPECIES: guanylate kinase [Novosphingobium]|uniref:Guanylate kinase n=1 Tax=Novosphingobium pentaromativorans US6-1 TaxID=1088721 RepID=G6E9L3_9SPHN|nr:MULTISPECIES: guanylate kinase [Novosphingobium]AIT80981.1 guanylate kinase [Novosphingobium pentaromativorans US6-1]EHJ62030.1 guanylate kinase [Novosphingobium pentaromativorans US6-1]GFM30218.1 guanylate kinase [Novosphingobium sp. PY1]
MDSASHPIQDAAAGGSLARRGLMFIMSSPSGAGKTTISRMLLERDEHICMSVSCTTRPPRPGEVDGKDYHFVSQAEFDRMVADEEFLEWATVFGNSYGTPKAQVKAGLKEGQDYLFDIDWQGTQQLYQKLERDVVRVFLLPPSIDELRRRLTGRGTDSEDVIAARMERARSEISHWDGYDYVVVNDDIDACFDKVREILAAERMRRARQTGLIGFVRELMTP